MFVSLHNHTEFSNLRIIDCTVKIRQLVDKAIKMGNPAIACTDHESLSAHQRLLSYQEEINKTNPDFKVILGNEIYLIPESAYKNTDKFFHCILLAKDLIGHRQLRELSSRAWERSYRHKGQERVPTFYSDIMEIVGANQGHLIMTTACVGGFLGQCILNDKIELAEKFLQWGTTTMGSGHFFIETQPVVSEEQILVNKMSISLAKKFDIPCVVTNDVHYLSKEDGKIHAAFLNSKDEEREVESFYAGTYFKTEEEMIEGMYYVPEEEVREMFANTCRIADMCERYSLKQNTIVPKRSIPQFELLHIFKEYYDEYEFIKNYAESTYEQDGFLLHQIEKGFLEKKQEFNDENLARIDIELKQLWLISEKMGDRLSAYYNLTQEIVDIIWDDDKGNSLVGVARGSVTGFYICYLMSITQINPIQWRLPYWRHLVSERPELPDADLDSEASRRPYILQSLKDNYGQNKVLNICTFKTEGTKAAVLTSCRGLLISIEEAQEIADMIPVTRGKTWTINECLYGDEETEKVPVNNFENLINKYPNLLNTILGIEGLVCGRGIHASGVLIFNQNYLEQLSMMKAPNGSPITCWSMEDSDLAGALKMDMLTVEALSKIRACMEFLLKDKMIEWQGSTRATYNKYLHPDVLDYETLSMWEKVSNIEIMDLFQFEGGGIGVDCVQKTKPTTLRELAFANSLMRLSPYQGEAPLDKYVRFKNNPALWQNEMTGFNLNSQEKRLLEKYLGDTFGIACEQEDIMTLSMEPKISNFNIKESNLLRKSISKKKKKLLDEAKEIFFRKGLEAGTRQNFLDYVWINCIMPQSGYSFSRNHTMPYSAIALQQMNLVEHYNPVYWNASCLTVNASADENSTSSGVTNYGKIATAISKMQKRNVQMDLPDINMADFGFKPNPTTNTITFGLKGINGVGDEIVKAIIDKRSYTSLEDFLTKHDNATKNVAVINLIKAGSFDKVENKPRKELMKEYVKYITILKNPPKKQLSMANFQNIVEYEMFVEQNWPMIKRQYSFYKYITQKQFERGNEKGDFKLYWLDPKAFAFFKEFIQPEMKSGVDYFIKDGEYHVLITKMKKWYENAILPFKKNFLSNDASVRRYNQFHFNKIANEFWNKYCEGTIEKWEMDSLSFYYTRHELWNVNAIKYGIVDFFQLPQNPTVNYTKQTKRGDYTQFNVYKIIGTVLDKDKIKKTISLLTPSGVVTVKFYGEIFLKYNKQISRANTDGTKTVVDKSWFSRGTKLQLTGYRRDDQFIPRVYNDLISKQLIAKISTVTPSGLMEFITERPTGVEEEETDE